MAKSKVNSILVFFLMMFGVTLHAQYVNTDSLVFSPDFQEPVTINCYEQMKTKEKAEDPGYFSQFLVPGNGGYIISQFGPRSGRMHYGTDIKMEKGDTVVAVFDGYVIRSSYGYGFGNLIVIQHENNLATYYAHLSAYLVSSGEWVHKGEAIGLAGSTGRARGPHLHFEMRENEVPFDSELVYDYKNQNVRGEAKEEESIMALHKKLKPQGYSTNAPVPEYYKVRSGDSLWVISRRFKTPINTICKLNAISENTVLQVGQPLKTY